jgi:hypothetical protein
MFSFICGKKLNCKIGNVPYRYEQQKDIAIIYVDWEITRLYYFKRSKLSTEFLTNLYNAIDLFHKPNSETCKKAFYYMYNFLNNTRPSNLKNLKNYLIYTLDARDIPTELKL